LRDRFDGSSRARAVDQLVQGSLEELLHTDLDVDMVIAERAT
jgi:hypothetical protein